VGIEVSVGGEDVFNQIFWWDVLVLVLIPYHEYLVPRTSFSFYALFSPFCE